MTAVTLNFDPRRFAEQQIRALDDLRNGPNYTELASVDSIIFKINRERKLRQELRAKEGSTEVDENQPKTDEIEQPNKVNPPEEDGLVDPNKEPVALDEDSTLDHFNSKNEINDEDDEENQNKKKTVKLPPRNGNKFDEGELVDTESLETQKRIKESINSSNERIKSEAEKLLQEEKLINEAKAKNAENDLKTATVVGSTEEFEKELQNKSTDSEDHPESVLDNVKEMKSRLPNSVETVSENKDQSNIEQTDTSVKVQETKDTPNEEVKEVVKENAVEGTSNEQIQKIDDLKEGTVQEEEKKIENPLTEKEDGLIEVSLSDFGNQKGRSAD